MTISLTALQAALAQETGEVFTTCLTITHPSLTSPLLVCDDTANLGRAGGTFLAFPFTVSLPAQQDDKPPVVKLSIDNVDRTVNDILRGFTSPATVTMEVVLASSPNVIEAGPFALTLRVARTDRAKIECDLTFEDFLNEPFPRGTFNPTDFSALFT